MNEYQKFDQFVITPMIEMIAKTGSPKGSDLESQKNLAHQIHEAFYAFETSLNEALTFLQKRRKLSFHAHFGKIAESLQERSQWEKEVAEGKTVHEILQITNRELATFYEEGLESYNQGSYEQAGHIFLLLTYLNPKVGSFWTALGATEEKRGELVSATQAYILAAELEFRTLAPYLQGAKCLLLLNKVEKAKEVLLRAIERAEQEPALKRDKEVAEQMLLAINQSDSHHL